MSQSRMQMILFLFLSWFMLASLPAGLLAAQLVSQSALIQPIADSVEPIITSSATKSSEPFSISIATLSVTRTTASNTTNETFIIEPYNQDFLLDSASETADKLWTLTDCLEFGLAHHPSIRQAIGAVESAKARLGTNRSTLGTKMSASAAFSRRRTEYSRALANARIPGSSDDLIDSTSESISVRKILTDFGKTSARLKSLNVDLQTAHEDRRWAEIQLCAEIKIAWLKALRAKALLAVQSENLARFQQHLEKVKGFVEVGSKPPYDITKAEVDVANARVSLISANSTFRNALSALRKAIGTNELFSIGPVEIASQPVLPELNVEKLLVEAMNHRPDLRSSKLALESAMLRLKEARLGKQPTLSGSADYSWNGSVTPLDRNYTLALSLTAPILDGRATNYSIREAKAACEISSARLYQLLLNLRHEIETAVTELLDAKQRYEAAKILVRQASETLDLAEGRYEAGLGSPIELTDARTGFTSARGSLITAYFDELIALATLDRVLGRFPPELQKWEKR